MNKKNNIRRGAPPLFRSRRRNWNEDCHHYNVDGYIVDGVQIISTRRQHQQQRQERQQQHNVVAQRPITTGNNDVLLRFSLGSSSSLWSYSSSSSSIQDEYDDGEDEYDGGENTSTLTMAKKEGAQHEAESVLLSTINNPQDDHKLFDRILNVATGRSLTAEYEDFANSGQARQLFLFHGLLYYSSAVTAMSFLFDDFTIIDSLYFATTVFTTVGYGDLGPTTPESRIFTMFLACYGIVILGLFIGVIGENVVNAHDDALKSRHVIGSQIVSGLRGEEEDERSPTETASLEAATDTPPPKENPEKSVWFTGSLSVIASVAPIIGVVLVFGLIIGRVEGWPVLESIYFSVITGTTIGFGDVAPRNEYVRLACCFFLPFSVAVVGELLGRIASAYMERHSDEVEKRFLERVLTMSDLERLDVDNNGVVDKAEFLSYMLVSLQKVEKEDVDDIMRLFKKLDVTETGTLTKDDISKLGWNESIRKASTRHCDTERIHSCHNRVMCD